MRPVKPAPGLRRRGPEPLESTSAYRGGPDSYHGSRSVAAVVRHGATQAVLDLPVAAMEAASPDALAEMITFLICRFGPGPAPFDRFAMAVCYQDKALQALLVAESRGPLVFGRVYHQLPPGRLLLALSGGQRLAAERLIEAHIHSPEPGDWDGFSTYVRDACRGLESHGNQPKFLLDGEEVSRMLERDIDRAAAFICIEVFAWHADDRGDHLFERLVRARQRSVDVYLKTCSVGTGWAGVWELRALKRKCVAAGIGLLVARYPGRFGPHDHRKLFVMDDGRQNAVSYVGSMNVGAHYQGAMQEWVQESGKKHAVADHLLRLDGRAACDSLFCFFDAWRKDRPLTRGQQLETRAEREGWARGRASQMLAAGGVDHRDFGEGAGCTVQVVRHDGFGADQFIKAVVLRAIYTAERSIFGAVPYYGDDEISEGLIAAAQRGVRVEIYFPLHSDVRPLQAIARSHTPALVAGGVRVYEFEGEDDYEFVEPVSWYWRVLGYTANSVPGRGSHTKDFVIDDVVISGSSNLDWRSMSFGDELNAVTYSAELAEEIRSRQFDRDREHSIPQFVAGPDGEGLLLNPDRRWGDGYRERLRRWFWRRVQFLL